MLSLILKSAEFEDELLEFSKGDHKTPEYRKLNPRAKVPTLVDGDVIVGESLAIIAYVDRKLPGRSLMGESAEEVGRISQLILDQENYLGKAGTAVFRPFFRKGADLDMDAVKSAVEELHTELAIMESRLQGSDWLAGDTVTAADIVHYPTVMSINRLASKPDIAKLDLGLDVGARYPKIAAWVERFGKLPGVARAHPPHWR